MRPELVDATLKRKQEEKRRQENPADIGPRYGERIHNLKLVFTIVAVLPSWRARARQ